MRCNQLTLFYFSFSIELYQTSYCPLTHRTETFCLICLHPAVRERSVNAFGLISPTLVNSDERIGRYSICYHFPDIIWFSTYAANVSVTRLPDFASAIFREKDLLIQENDKRYLGSMQYFRMLLLLSYTYSVAPERLLLQDYSAQAVQPDGTPFSPDQIQFLGAYLRGTSHVQTLASNEILALSCGLS